MQKVFGTIVCIFSESDELRQELLIKSIRFGNMNSFAEFRSFMIQYANLIHCADKISKITVIIEPNTESWKSLNTMRINFEQLNLNNA